MLRLRQVRRLDASTVHCPRGVGLLGYTSPPKVQSLPVGGSGSSRLRGPTRVYRKRHLDRFSRFCGARGRDQRTDEQTEHYTTLCPKSEPPKHFATATANLHRVK